MKTTLFFFTGTGNSLKVARDLAESLGDTDIEAISKNKDTELNLSTDCIGLVFPVYMWGLPLIVCEFVKRLKPQNAGYFFAVATCAGQPAATMIQLESILKDRGIVLSAGFVIKMPSNYIPMVDAKPQKVQEELFLKEKKRIAEITDKIKTGKQYKVEKGSAIGNLILSGVVYRISSPHIPEMDKSFFADDRCTGCGTCSKICPVGNIKMENEKPVWLHNCQQCLACLQWCPAQACQYGKGTVKRKRYRHPEISLKDLI